MVISRHLRSATYRLRNFVLSIFCSKSKNLPNPKETFSHFYLSCPVTTYLFEKYFEQFLAHTDVRWSNDMTILGALENLNSNYKLIINIEILTVLHFVYTEKTRKKYPYLNNLKDHTTYYREIFNFSNRYKKAYESFRTYNPNFNIN